MPARPADPAKIEEARRLIAAGASRTEASRLVGVNRDTLLRYIPTRPGPPRAATPGVSVTIDEARDTATVEGVSSSRIRTAEEAIRYAGLDPAEWRVVRVTANAWQVGMKLRTFEAGKVSGEAPRTEQLWQVKVVLERVAPKPILDAVKILMDRVAKGAAKYPKFRRPRPLSGMLAEFLMFDCHFGKLAWAPESGQNYDLKIAERVYREAVDEFLQMSAAYPISRFLLPVGNDFLHFDNPRQETSRGTRMDADGRLKKVYRTAYDAVFWAVERMAEVAPVDVLWVPGNHDHMVSWFLCRELSARFSKHQGVSVEVGASSRSYYHFGRTLLGFTHGDKESHAALADIMANERPREWAESDRREWRIGHLHHKRVGYSLPVTTRGGVRVHMVQALSGTDAYHHEHGWVSSNQAAEMFLHEPSGRRRMHFEVDSIRERA